MRLRVIYSGVPDAAYRDLNLGPPLGLATVVLGSSPGLRVAIAAGDSRQVTIYPRLKCTRRDACW